MKDRNITVIIAAHCVANMQIIMIGLKFKSKSININNIFMLICQFSTFSKTVEFSNRMTWSFEGGSD